MLPGESILLELRVSDFVRNLLVKRKPEYLLTFYVNQHKYEYKILFNISLSAQQIMLIQSSNKGGLFILITFLLLAIYNFHMVKRTYHTYFLRFNHQITSVYKPTSHF